jgi:hypothetical protein
MASNLHPERRSILALAVTGLCLSPNGIALAADKSEGLEEVTRDPRHPRPPRRTDHPAGARTARPPPGNSGAHAPQPLSPLLPQPSHAPALSVPVVRIATPRLPAASGAPSARGRTLAP